MTLNPIIEESVAVYFRARPYRRTLIAYVGILAIATLIVWPSRGFMEFFATETLPSAFEAMAVLQVLVLTGLSTYAGMDRFAASQIIRYSEWLEHTQIPVSTLFVGKTGSSFFHTVVIVALGAPFLVIASGPAGIPLRAVFATAFILLVVSFFCRVTGMLISLLGERSDVLRIVGSWVFLALLYLATLQLVQPFNPIIAVARQQNEGSALVTTAGAVAIADNPMLPSSIWYLSATMLVLAAYAFTMRRQRNRALQRGGNG